MGNYKQSFSAGGKLFKRCRNSKHLPIVKTACGFIKDNDITTARDSAADSDTLFLPARKCHRMIFRILLKIEPLKNFKRQVLILRFHAEQDFVQNAFSEKLMVHILHNQVRAALASRTLLTPRALQSAQYLRKR